MSDSYQRTTRNGECTTTHESVAHMPSLPSYHRAIFSALRLYTIHLDGGGILRLLLVELPSRLRASEWDGQQCSPGNERRVEDEGARHVERWIPVRPRAEGVHHCSGCHQPHPDKEDDRAGGNGRKMRTKHPANAHCVPSAPKDGRTRLCIARDLDAELETDREENKRDG
jgi:hypothetical protein